MIKDKLSAPLLIAIICLMPWLAHLFTTAMNADVSWFLIAAQRMADGLPMSEYYFEPNPPLTIVFHLLPLAFAKLTCLGIHYGTLLFFILMIAGSVGLSAVILKQSNDFDDTQKFAILSVFTAALTIGASLFFGEREHVVLMALLPMILMSFAPKPVFSDRTRGGVFFLGSLLIMLKPHFLIVPGLLCLYRIYLFRGKILSYAPEVTGMIAAILVYFISTVLFFPDYIQTILPEVVDIYAASAMPAETMNHLMLYGPFAVMMIAIEAFISPLKKRQKKFLLSLYALSLVCLIPVALQMKGFGYHIIPAGGIFFIAFVLSILSHVQTIFRGKSRHAALLLPVLIFGAAYMYRPLMLSYPSPDDYKILPFGQALAEHCSEDSCGAFIFFDRMESVPETMLYTGTDYASRFPAYWFLPFLEIEGRLPPEQQKKLREKYRAMVGEDMEKFKPDVMILMEDVYFNETTPFNFVEYFSADPAFRKEMRHYRKVDDLSFNRRVYFPGTNLDADHAVSFTVYARR